MLVAAVLTGYFQPASHFLTQNLFNWFLDLRQQESGQEYGDASAMPAQPGNCEGGGRLGEQASWRRRSRPASLRRRAGQAA